MPHERLKILRIAVAVVVFAGFTATFVDFRDLVPPELSHWLASTQFVPSLVALATGAAFAAGCMLVILLTLVAGRVYCSTLCPLGILQDIITRVAGLIRRQQHFLPYARPLDWLRHIFLWGTVAAVVAGWGGLALALLDPYSNFGRIASVFFRPLLTLANNSVVAVANTVGFHGVYRVDVPWAGAGVIMLVAGFFAAVIVMSAFRGRLYCNTICPVGTLLGLVSARAAFRLRIDESVCVRCGQCLRHCKAQCIDLRTKTIDASRCVACYDCVAVCDGHGIGYSYSWKTAATPPAPALSAPQAPTDPRRRTFIISVAATVAGVALAGNRARAATASGDEIPALAKAGEDSLAIVPPGAAGTGQFLSRCTSCHLCISACPTHVLQPALLEYGITGLLKPRLDYTSSFCNFDCVRCGEVCPAGAIERIAPAEKQVTQIGVADFYPARCIVVTNGTDCAACSEHCPTKAVSTQPYGNNLRIPVLNQQTCIGCGACEFACPATPRKAIRVTGRRLHGRASKLVEEKATAPATADFPF